MPSWMNCLHKTFTNSSTKGNIRLFIARLITNRPKVTMEILHNNSDFVVTMVKVFQPYAQFWLDPLIQLLITDDNKGMHYLVVEVTVTMLTWAQTAIPNVRHHSCIQYFKCCDNVIVQDRFMASRLLEFLMQNAGHSNRQIFKNNLEIIKTLVECWRNKLDIPTKYDHF